MTQTNTEAKTEKERDPRDRVSMIVVRWNAEKWVDYEDMEWLSKEMLPAILLQTNHGNNDGGNLLTLSEKS